MNDVIKIVDPVYTWVPWMWVGGIVVTVFIASGILYALTRVASTRRIADNLHEAGNVVGIIALILIPVGALISACISWAIYSSDFDHRKEVAMSEAGYHSVDYNKQGEFVGRKDGKYVRGVVIETGDLTWQVLLVDIPDKKG